MTIESPSMSFEEALTKLEEVVKQLEGGKLSLEESIKTYEEGIKLRRFCESILKDAQLKIDQISVVETPSESTGPADDSRKSPSF